MANGVTAAPRTPRPPGFTRPDVRRRSHEPHLRRRRAFALLAILVLAGMAAVGLLTGGSTPVPRAVAQGVPGYFARIETLAGNGPGSFSAIESTAENAAINRTLAYTPYVRVAGGQHKEMALTFDDGPGPYTPAVLSVLEKANVPGTFFEVGIEERYFHAATTRIVRDGYPIGDHTENHSPMSHLTRGDQQSQLLTQISRVAPYGASFPRMFRPPYGLWNATTLSILHKMKMLMVLWTIDTSDYRQPGVAAIVHRVLAGARPGAIVLLHDAGGNRAETVAALPKIISGLRERGYTLVTVPKLLLDNPAPANQHIASLAGSGG